MAPSRRKGGGRASAATAAARKQWKVGDLVLAKVKGFPAWPATVSEPEKWGYSTDWKKVLVFFFGTQQIAFCNPADVEEFTEEKKESLLVKRHGKGADFVRAVHEIIESYEKLKKRDQIDVNTVDKVTATNVSNSMDNSALKDQIEAPSEMGNSCVKRLTTSGDQNESNVPVKGAPDATLADRDTSSEEPIDNFVVTRRPLVSTSSKKRLGSVQPQGSTSLKTGPSSRSSRISSRVDASRLQMFVLPSSNGSDAAEDVAAKVLQNGLVRRSKRIRKSPDVYEGHDTGSPVFLSNGSIEENGSEIVTADSDTFSITEGSTVESGCKLLQPEFIVERCEGDVELIQALDFHTKAVVLKKKRKPNRKRVSNDCSETTGRLNNEAGLEIELQRTGQISQNSHEKLNERYSKEDGDEHLPLVKRARVRMGRPSSVEEELDTCVQSEEKLLEASNSFSGLVSTSLNCEEDGPTDIKSFVGKGVTDNSSAQSKCPQSLVDNRVLEVKKIQQFCCSVDGEAALPPSKRLHRALEAMSANAAEDGQTEALSGIKALINGCTRDSSTENGEGNGFGLQNLDVLINAASQDDISATSSCPAVPKESAKSLSPDGPVGGSSKQELQRCKDIHVVAVDHADFRGLSVSTSGTLSGEVVVVNQSPKPLSPDAGKGQSCLGCGEGSLAQALPRDDECRSGNPEFGNDKDDNALNEVDPSECSGTSSDPVTIAVDVKVLPQNDINMPLCSTEGNCSGNSKLLKLPLQLNNQVDRMCEAVKEIKPAHRDSNDIATPTSVKVTEVAVEGPSNLCGPTSISDDHLGGRDIIGVQSSSSPTDGLGSPACSSPRAASACNISMSGNNIVLEKNGHCSPGVHFLHVKSRDAGKWSNKTEATAALASFQAVVGTLTRTKESIGRATRVAIDCAKFGIAAKVVEILARNLESESSLHRRIDLFFLVDSITQCSRGLKGDVGDIYPSAIQAVLSRLLLAAAPPGSSAQENRRQCLKVLRLWLERRILPDSIIRHHIRDLESLSGSSSSGAFSRRPLRTERAFDDPIREMEGMLVDEYGSNSSFQLPGFRMPCMLKDEDDGSDSDGGSFEAVTPEHNVKSPEEREKSPMPATIGKHRHILEDVDGELEMEDVAPRCEAEMSSTSNAGISNGQTLHPQFELHFAPSFGVPVPKDVPPSSPPLPASPPPPPPPPPPAIPPPPIPDLISNGLNSKLYVATHNIKENMHHSMIQQPVAQRINSITSDAVCYRAPESRDVQMQTQIADSASLSFFSGIPVSRPTNQPVNSALQTDGNFHNSAYHLRPPLSAPSNQFSYVQADQRAQSLREIPPPSYPNRGHFVQSTDGGNFYTDHDRMKLAPHELRESWRFSGPSFSGTFYPDPPRGSHPPGPCIVPPYEPPLSNHRWGFGPRGVNYGEPMAHRPPSEGPMPVATRVPSFWRPG